MSNLTAPLLCVMMSEKNIVRKEPFAVVLVRKCMRAESPQWISGSSIMDGLTRGKLNSNGGKMFDVELSLSALRSETE